MLKMSIQSIQCWDSNSQPSEHRFPPITTKPGLPPLCRTFCPADDDDDVDDADMQSNKFIFLFSIFHVSRKTKGVSLNWLKRVLNGQEERERERSLNRFWNTIPREHFSRWRWRLISAQLSNKSGYCPLYIVSFVLQVHKHNSLPLEQIQAFIFFYKRASWYIFSLLDYDYFLKVFCKVLLQLRWMPS